MYKSFDVFHIGTLVKAGVPIWNGCEWKDKAGGYGIQTAFGAIAVKRIEGDYYNVIGLPIGLLYRMLKQHYSGLFNEDEIIDHGAARQKKHNGNINQKINKPL